MSKEAWYMMIKICQHGSECVYRFRSDFEKRWNAEAILIRDALQSTLGERERERDAVKIKGIGYHRFNDFTVRMNDSRVWRCEGKIKEADGVKTLSDMLAASSSHSATQSSSHSHFGGLHLDHWMDHAYHIMGNQRHVPSCETPHLSDTFQFSSGPREAPENAEHP